MEFQVSTEVGNGPASFGAWSFNNEVEDIIANAKKHGMASAIQYDLE